MSNKPNIEPIPGTFNDKSLRGLFFRIQNIFNNFSGQYLSGGTVTADKLLLSSGDIPAQAIAVPWNFPLALPGEDVITASTTYVRCSGIFAWDPAAYPTTGGSWYFEASLAVNDAAAIATAHLMGISEVTNSVVTHTGDTYMTLVRSSPLTMPTSAANLYVEFHVSNSFYTASFGGARLIFVPA